MKYFLLIFIFYVPVLSASSPVWWVESGQNRLFLAGTIHLLRSSDFPLPPAFNNAYQQSTRLVFETDIDKTQQAAFQARLMSVLRMEPGQQIKDLISAQTLARLETYMHSRQLSLAQFNEFKPSMLAITLTVLELQKLGIGSPGVDEFFFERAKRDHKPVLALESVEQQIEFLASMGDGQEDLMIQQTLEEIETLPEHFPLMVKSWREGNSNELETLFIEPMKLEFKDLYERLLVERNLNWLPQLMRFLDSPETEMVLVGSAHLVGEDGLIKLLEKAGYSVTQVD
jgi:hypothetical protein